MSYTYYIDTNATLAAVEVYKYKGAYPSFDGLIIAHPVAEPGDYATVAENDRVLLYVWVEDSWVLPINNLASPTLTGNPTAPTPTATDNSTSIATTAFVRAAMALDISRSVDTRFTEYRTVSTSAPSGVPRDGEEWIVVD